MNRFLILPLLLFGRPANVTAESWFHYSASFVIQPPDNEAYINKASFVIWPKDQIIKPVTFSDHFGPITKSSGFCYPGKIVVDILVNDIVVVNILVVDIFKADILIVDKMPV